MPTSIKTTKKVTEEKQLAIVIPVFENWHYTNRILRQLASLPQSHVTIVIDNASNDETKNLEGSSKVLVYRNQTNEGFGRACNRGYYEAKNMGFEHVMFLNNDIQVLSSPESWTLPVIEESKKGFIVGPTAGYLDEGYNFVCETSKWPSKGYGYLSGWCITSSVSVWDELIINDDIGPFSTEFFAYFEDTDLSFRAKEKGIPLKLVPVPVRHIGRATGKKLGLSSIYAQSQKTFLDKWKKHE